MVRFLKTTAALAALAVISLPSVASAGKVTILASSTQGSDNKADEFASDFSAFLAPNAFWVAPGAAAVTPPPASVGGVYKSPWVNTDLGDSFIAGGVVTDPTPLVPDNTYWSVGPGTGSAPSPQTMNFTSAQTSFDLLWGSIDSYNKIEFFDAQDGASGTGNLLASWTGAQLVANVDTDNVYGTVDGCSASATNFECVARVRFSEFTSGFSSIQFSSNATGPVTTGKDVAAFEFATIPLPAAAWLLLGVSGALVAGKRRAARRDA